MVHNILVRLVCNSLFLLVVILISSCSFSNTEKASTEESLRKEISFDCGYDCELGDWIRKDIPWNEPNSSTPSWAFFYFKVSNSGEVDSLYHRGTVRSEVADKIKHNIYQTKGHWKIPDGFQPNDYQWFVLPYFDLGEIPCFSGTNCSKEDSIFQSSMRSLLWNMGDLERAVKDRHAKISSPTYIGGGIPRM